MEDRAHDTPSGADDRAGKDDRKDEIRDQVRGILLVIVVVFK